MEDLRSIGDSAVLSEILRLARQELREPSGDEGGLAGRVGGLGFEQMMWRRAVPISDLHKLEGFDLHDEDEPGNQAHDHVLVYRWMTSNEMIDQKVGKRTLLVVRVLHNRDLVPLITRRYGAGT